MFNLFSELNMALNLKTYEKNQLQICINFTFESRTKQLVGISGVSKILIGKLIAQITRQKF